MKGNFAEKTMVISVVLFATALFINVVEASMLSSRDARAMLIVESLPSFGLLHLQQYQNYQAVCDDFRSKFSETDLKNIVCQDTIDAWAFEIAMRNGKKVCITSLIINPVLYDPAKSPVVNFCQLS